MDADSQRKLFFKSLNGALWNEDEEGGNNNTTFAGGGNINTQNQQQGNSLLESLHVEGAGELQLPLSSEDFAKLLGVSEPAPYGHGFATVVNPAVRRAWQVDASKVTFPRTEDFVSKTIRQLGNKAVRALGLDGAALQLEAHLYKLLLYEVDGHFSLHRDTEKEPGMFATLILQLPTQEGFGGGTFLVRQGGITKTFDFSLDSATIFSYTVFYADCEHELQRITSGKRVCLAFNLVRGSSLSFGSTQLEDLKEFSSRLSKVETALLPWRNAQTIEEPRDVFPSDKLAIPLQHKYTKKNLSFSGLKGDDRIVAHVLKTCRDDLGRPWLDLFLCIYTRHQTGQPGEIDYWDRRRYDDSDGDDSDGDGRLRNRHTMDDIIDESSECSNWVGINNKACNLTLEIREGLEVVVDDEGQEFFDEGAEPDEVAYEGYTGNEGPTLEYWYHKAMIVIWPRKKSIVMAFKDGIAGALDMLETRLKGDPDTVTMLHEVVSYCERNRAKIWGANSLGRKSLVGSRLLKLCNVEGGLGDVVRVLKLLSEPSKLEGDGSVCTIGIVDADTSTAIASAVRTHGWVDCGPFVLNMLGKEQVMGQGRCFAHLALELHKLGCEDASLLVAKRTLELTFVVDSSLKQLQGEMIVSMGKLIFGFKECMSEVGLKFVERLEKLSTDVLCSLVIQVFATFSKEVTQVPSISTEEDSVSGAFLFRRICQIVTTRNFHSTTTLESHVVELVRTFSLLGDEQLLNNLLQAFLDQSQVLQQQRLLKNLLGSDAIWTDFSGTAIGRSKLKLLADERILELSQPEPRFTWRMPSAQFPRHPDVEAFLRGPRESFTYTGLNNWKHALNFSRKYFGHGGYRDGYSAIGTASFSERGYACCVITKTRTAFQQQWKREQQEELPRLRERLAKLHNAATEGYGAESGSGRTEVVTFSSPDASNELRKRRKVEKTEYIDLTLDDDE